MGMRTLPVVSDEKREIALKLPRGSISPKGRTVVPVVRPALYGKLLAIAGPSSYPGKPGEQQPPNAADAKQAANAADAKPDATTGSKLTKGQRSARQGKPRRHGLVRVDHLEHRRRRVTLRWQAWPDYPKFNRKVTQVALTHPKMVKPAEHRSGRKLRSDQGAQRRTSPRPAVPQTPRPSNDYEGLPPLNEMLPL
jgi:hypothetical protein